MPRTAHVSNVYPLHPELPALTARERAGLDMIELLRDLDTDSQQAIVDQLSRTAARIRPYSRVARLLVHGVAWRRGPGPLWLVAPASRRYLYLRAHA